MGGDSGPVGPFVIHVAGGQRARQSVVPDRLQGKMFYNRILFSVISFKSRVPIVLHIFSDDPGGSSSKQVLFLSLSPQTAISFVQKEYDDGNADYFMCLSYLYDWMTYS